MNLEYARLLIVVKDADYREHFGQSSQSLNQRLETVDRHILRAAIYWRLQMQDVAIFSTYSAVPYSLNTDAGIRLIGSGLSPDEFGGRKQNRLVADFCPTHILFCTPAVTVLAWANRNRIPSVVLLRDWQEPLGWRQRRQHAQLIKQLNGDSVHWVGSHGLYACKILQASGIYASKLIPWEWSELDQPAQYPPKPLRYDHDTLNLIYVGEIDAEARLSDLLLAIRHLQQKGMAVRLTLLYPVSQYEQAMAQAATERALVAVSQSKASLISSLTALRSQVHHLDLADSVIPMLMPDEPTLLQQIRVADLLVIPGHSAQSLHTIRFAMAARTPIVAADHPNFREHLRHGVNAMIFPAGNAKSMAHRIERIMSQPQLYAQISEALDVALGMVKVPARWTQLIDYWLHSGEAMPAGKDNHQQLCNWAVSSGRYSKL